MSEEPFLQTQVCWFSCESYTTMLSFIAISLCTYMHYALCEVYSVYSNTARVRERGDLIILWVSALVRN